MTGTLCHKAFKTLLGLSLLLALSASPGVATMPFSYRYPTSLSMKMELISKDRSEAILIVTVKSLVGTLRELELYFYSADNMSTQPSSAKLPVLPEGQQKQYEIKVTKTILNKKSEWWLQLRVDYYMDYAALRQIVMTDPKYSETNARSNLLGRLGKNEESGRKAREGMTYNF
jgi:hypothetical protein